MQLSIGGIEVGSYIQGYSEEIEKVYDTANSFIASDGTEHKKCSGSRKKISLSLGNVPVAVKNQLKVKSGSTQLTAVIDGASALYDPDNFSAVSIIKTDSLDLWTVAISLNDVSISSAGAEISCDYSVTHLGTE